MELRSLERACLQFCVELLDQHYEVETFECALVCALAALSHDDKGWLRLVSYVDILSKMIRIGQSLMVQHTLLLGSDAEERFEVLKRREAGLQTAEMLCEIPYEDDSESEGPTHAERLDFWLETTRTIRVKTPMVWMMSIAFEI